MTLAPGIAASLTSVTSPVIVARFACPLRFVANETKMHAQVSTLIPDRHLGRSQVLDLSCIVNPDVKFMQLQPFVKPPGMLEQDWYRDGFRILHRIAR